MFGDTPEVLIVGAGPVGQFAALSLIKRGIKVRIVDRGIWPCAQSYALALHPQSLDLLRSVGLLEDVLAHAIRVRRIALYEGLSHRANIDLDPSFMAVVRQDMLESLLERALDESGVEIQWRHEVPRLIAGVNEVEAKIDKFEKESRGYIVAHTEWVIAKSITMNVPFVIGADGYNSRVRRALKLDFPPIQPAQYFAVFEFSTDQDLGEEMRVVLGDQTTDVLWPLPGGSCRWSFELPLYHEAESDGGLDLPSERKKDRMPPVSEDLDPSMLRSLIADRAPWFAGSIGEVAWHSVVRFEKRLTPRFGAGRMWLAGDAAHLTGPVGVQSMNVGLHEAASLADAIHDVLRNGAPLSRLDAYDQRWTSVWRQLHGLSGELTAAPAAQPWIAEKAPRLLSCLPAHGSMLASLAAQIGLVLPGSAQSAAG